MLSRIGEILFSNLGIKAGSLALALLVYFHIYSQKEREFVLSVPLHYTGLHSSLAMGNDPPRDMRLRVRGSLDQILRFKIKSSGVDVNLGDAGPGMFQRSLGSPDVIVPIGIRAQVTEVIEPKVVTVELDSLLTKTVPLIARIEGTPGSGYDLSGAPVPEPAWILLRGPARSLTEIDSLWTAPVRIQGLRETKTFTARIELAVPGVSLSADEVMVTVSISRVAKDARVRKSATARTRSG